MALDAAGVERGQLEGERGRGGGSSCGGAGAGAGLQHAGVQGEGQAPVVGRLLHIGRCQLTALSGPTLCRGRLVTGSRGGTDTLRPTLFSWPLLGAGRGRGRVQAAPPPPTQSPSSLSLRLRPAWARWGPLP